MSVKCLSSTRFLGSTTPQANGGSSAESYFTAHGKQVVYTVLVASFSSASMFVCEPATNP
jgi:hypothetical protein